LVLPVSRLAILMVLTNGARQMINLYYVFLDTSNTWLTKHDGSSSKNWTDAKEFHNQEDAEKTAERHSGVVFGWVQ
jgi:hypothetical protein